MRLEDPSCQEGFYFVLQQLSQNATLRDPRMGRTSCSWALGLGLSVCNAAVSVRVGPVWGCGQSGRLLHDGEGQVCVSLRAPHLDHRLVTQQLDRCVHAEETSFHAHSCTTQYSWPFKEDLPTSRLVNLNGWFFQKQ